MNSKLKNFIALVVLCVMPFVGIKADDWKVYASYHNATKAVKTDSRIFVLANGDLYSYDTEDNSLATYDKVGGLCSFGIEDMAYCAAEKTLVLYYADGNIDLLNVKGTIWNMSELKNKAMSDKTFRELKVVGSEALLSLGSSVAVVNIAKGNFADLYTFESKVTNATVQNGKMYVKTADGVYEGDRKKNLLDKSNWMKVSGEGVQFGETEAEKTEHAKALETVQKAVPDSPLRNYSYRLRFFGDDLYVVGGNQQHKYQDRTATVMKYSDGRWSAFEEDKARADVPDDQAFMNFLDIAQDPKDAEHFYVNSMRSGIYEYKGGKFVKRHSSDNSLLRSILPENRDYYRYVWVSGMEYDRQGNLWFMNGAVDSTVHVIKPDGKWLRYYYDDMAKKDFFPKTIFDQRGWLWTVQWHRYVPKYSFVYVIDTKGTIDTEKDDKRKNIVTFVNQDGTEYEPAHYNYIIEDLDGAIWIATSAGVFVSFNPADVFNSNFYFTQVKVPRNDGTNLADYLLNGVDVQCIAVDGGNRKWMGTTGNGVYLVSADGTEVIEHFTAENSDLICNDINDIAINGKTGEVFIATEQGLCSYQGDATDPESSLKSSNLKVWPNPVNPDYQGDVHISGLMRDTDVKIVSAAGRLVYQGKSVGGEFSWNCCYTAGHKVSTGIYYALCTDEEGKEGACAKILIVK